MKKFIVNRSKKFFSSVKSSPNRIKDRIDKTKKIFKAQYHEARQKPISKKKSAFLGFSAVMAIFGTTMLADISPAIAKDVPAPKPIANQKLREGLGGFAAAVCAGAASSGSFLLGAICGIVVVVGILARDK